MPSRSQKAPLAQLLYAGLFLIPLCVGLVFVNLWRETFTVLLPDSAHNTVTTDMAKSLCDGVCFTLHGRSQCGNAYELRDMERWHFNATRDGWTIAGQANSAFATEPQFYPVLTGASASRLSAFK